MSGVVIDVQGLAKKFVIGSHTTSDLRSALSLRIKKMIGSAPSSGEEFWALNNINFRVEQGEAIGIIGRNGAGKSTLLKILSRITEPTKGRFELVGRTSALLEVGTGFHMELTGRENIYLNGTILGMRRSEIKSKLDDIIEFSGVEKFLDTAVKHYSSGMKVRLAFSVAAHLEPDILIIDEVLAVGDSEFQKKCLGKMDEVSRSKGRTILFVSHNMGAVSQLCTRGIVLDRGQIVFNGPSSRAIDTYNSLQNDSSHWNKKTPDGNKNFNITEVSLENKEGVRANIFAHDEPILLKINFLVEKSVSGFNICFAVYNGLKQIVFTSDLPLTDYRDKNSTNLATACIPSSTLTSGGYSLMVAIHDPIKGAGAVEYLEYICPFQVFDNGSQFLKYEGVWDIGNVFVNCEWKFEW